MTLTLLILLPFLGGIAALFAGRLDRDAARWVSILALVLTLFVLISTIINADAGRWLAAYRLSWAPALGLQIYLAMDGLSAALLAVSIGLGIISVIVSWNIDRNAPLLNAALCWTVAASNGVFLSFDLLLFAFFWESMLVPTFLLISLWGHGNREAAAFKFLIFNATAGLGLLAAIFYLGGSGGTITFDAFVLAKRDLPQETQIWLLLGFALAFLVKLPVPPLHAWLPDAHTQAPTAGSILLAGLLLKTGAYGLFRFPALLFPEGMVVLAPYGLVLGAFGTIYGALMACSQTDAKRLIAYTSISHMGLVLVGICGGVHFAMMGAAIMMIAHAFSASAMFLLVGAIYDRVGTRDIRQLGGLQHSAPRFAAAFALFFSATLAMPGTANFLGEALVITGMFQVNWVYALLALAALVVSVVYATRLFKAVVFGRSLKSEVTEDLTARELGPVIALAVFTLLFGLLPQLLMIPFEPAVNAAVQSLSAVRP